MLFNLHLSLCLTVERKAGFPLQEFQVVDVTWSYGLHVCVSRNSDVET